MTLTQWGRRETFYFPPHQPIYSIGNLLLWIMLTILFLILRMDISVSPLGQTDIVIYVRTGVAAYFSPTTTAKFSLFCISDGVHTHIAKPTEVVRGKTILPNGKKFNLAPSDTAQARGYSTVLRGPEAEYIEAALHQYLRLSVYGGLGLKALFMPPILTAFCIFVALFPYCIYLDIKRTKLMKYGRLLRGPIVCTPAKFNEAIKGDGLVFLTTEKANVIIPKSAESKHFEIIADTGAGKTALIMQMLRQVQERNEGAIIYDPAGEFVERFYNEGRGDVILNPTDARCPYWSPAEELTRKAEARTLAASLFQSTQEKKGEFFVESPQKIFAHLLTFGPTPEKIAEWMANPAEIDRRVQGTEYALLIDPRAPQQRTGVLSSLGMVADSLRMLPKKSEAKRRWNATEWSEKREGWIFMTSQATVRESLRPLHSLWIDWLVLRLMTIPKPGQRPVWFIIDDLAGLQKLPQLHTALTENRKSKNPIVMGFQGKAQLEMIYGHYAEVMLSQPATKIFLKTGEEQAALWVSKTLGDVEIERVKLTHHEGGTTGGKNYSVDRQIDPAIMPSEIEGLPDLHALLKYENYIVRFAFPYPEIPKTQPGLVPRPVLNDELNFDPTLSEDTNQNPLPSAPQPAAAPPPTAPPLSTPAPTPAAQTITQTQPTTQEKPLTSTDQLPLFSDDADAESEPDPEADEAMSSEPSESDTSTVFTFN
jgi:hypothetical protein